MDYCIRMNKAADLADEGLRRQGIRFDNIEEVTWMFVKFCPDPSLASIFRCKPIQEWSGKEIQSRIDDYQREFMCRGNTSVNLRSHSTAGFSNEHMYDGSKSESAAVPIQSFCSLPDAQVCRQPEPILVPSQAQRQPSSRSIPAPAISQHTTF